MFFKQFGGKVTKELKAEYSKSTNWKDGSFQNLEKTKFDVAPSKIPSIIYKQISQRKNQTPNQPLPILPFNKKEFLTNAQQAKFIWYGHSVVLMQMNGKTLLIDPMLGPDTSPIAPITTKRFSENTLDLIDEFPEIDLVFITHDHYDHLDYASIQKLKSKTKKYFVALGIKRHLISWGVEENRIQEFDWWDSQEIHNIQITFTPTRHFSGRGLRDRQKCLWGGWAFKTKHENIWFSGDGGYGEHFKTVGEKLGPFDFAFMECGQYNDYWRPIHLFPDECVQAAMDAQVKKAMPVHWCGFPLSFQHTWEEPAEAFVQAAIKEKLPYAVPTLGQLFDIDTVLTEKWWDTFSSTS